DALIRASTRSDFENVLLVEGKKGGLHHLSTVSRHGDHLSFFIRPARTGNVVEETRRENHEISGIDECADGAANPLRHLTLGSPCKYVTSRKDVTHEEAHHDPSPEQTSGAKRLRKRVAGQACQPRRGQRRERDKQDDHK